MYCEDRQWHSKLWNNLRERGKGKKDTNVLSFNYTRNECKQKSTRAIASLTVLLTSADSKKIHTHIYILQQK